LRRKKEAEEEGEKKAEGVAVTLSERSRASPGLIVRPSCILAFSFHHDRRKDPDDFIRLNDQFAGERWVSEA
jgi:hypothetical protein